MTSTVESPPESPEETSSRELEAKEIAARREAARLAAERAKLDSRRFWIMVLVEITQVVLGILAIIVAQRQVSAKVDAVKEDVRQLKAASSFSIESEGTGVGEFETIRGTTPYVGRNHYVVVEPEVSHESWVHGPASVTTSGEWQVRVQFGQGTIGLHKQFTIRCLVTKESIPMGRLRDVPDDAIFSAPMTVERTR